MLYTVQIGKKAVKILEKIDEPYYSRIKAVILSLRNNPRPAGYEKLKGREGYRIRSGDYRIIYEIFDQVLKVNVVAVGNRKDVYR
jgi:mRNA interferase RelE/StbE